MRDSQNEKSVCSRRPVRLSSSLLTFLTFFRLIIKIIKKGKNKGLLCVFLLVFRQITLILVKKVKFSCNFLNLQPLTIFDTHSPNVQKVQAGTKIILFGFVADLRRGGRYGLCA